MTTNPMHATSGPGTTPRGHGKFTPVDPIRVVLQNRNLLIVSFIVSAVVGIGVWFLLSQFAPRYTSTVQLNVTGGISDPYQGIEDNNRNQLQMDLLDAFILNQTYRLLSDEVLYEVLQREDVRQTQWFSQYADDVRSALNNLQRKLRVAQIRGTTLIGVSLACRDEADPRVLLDAVTNVYLNKLRAESESDSTHLRQTFVQERDRAAQDLAQLQEQLRVLTIQGDLPKLQAAGNEASIAYQLLADQMVKQDIILQTARDTYQGLLQTQQSGQIINTPEEIAEVESDPAIVQRQEQLRQLREQRDVYLARFGDKHRSVHEIDLQMLAIEQEMDRYTEQLLREREAVNLGQAANLADGLQAQYVSLQAKLEQSRARMRDLSLRLEEYQRIEDLASTAALRRAKADELLNEMWIQTNRPDSIRVRKVFSATEAELTFPKPLVIIPGITLMGLALIAGMVFLKEMMDQRIKSPSDILLLQEIELLGVVPDVSEDPSGTDKIESVVRSIPTGLIAESFRHVRAALLSQMDRRGYKSLLVVGAQPGCGTSAVLGNVAMSLAYNGRNVLVIDANFRRPSQHKLFDTALEPGLADVLTDAAEFAKVVGHVEEPKLDVLSAGNISQATPEMLEGPAFRNLLSDLESRYDLILIDVPPALLASESAQLAKYMDAVVVVVRAMVDMRGMVERMLRQLTGHRADVLGVILNGATSSAGGYFRKSYEEFYSYHEQNGGGEGNRVRVEAESLRSAIDR